MKKFVYILFVAFLFVSCGKADRVERQDSKYIYVWKYDGGDSVLVRYSQPVLREFNVMGGHHKNHHIRVDFKGNGVYDCCRLPYNNSVNRCKTVDIAKQAAYKRKPVVGIFKEKFYPYHEFIFIKYK